MEYFERFFVLTGAVFWSWLLIGLRDGNARDIRSDPGRRAIVLLMVLGLLVGWAVQGVTGNFALLGMVSLAIAIAVLAELSRMC